MKTLSKLNLAARFSILRFSIVLALICAFSPTLLAQKHKIKIGLIAPLSGEYSALSLEGIKWAELAIKDFNEDYDVELIAEDDQFKASLGISAAKKLLTIDKVDALINVSTPTANALYDFVSAKGLPTIQIGVMERQIKDNFFLIQPEPSGPLHKTATKFALEYNSKNIVIFYYDDPAAEKLVQTFRNGIKTTCTEIPISPGETNFRSFATKAVHQKADLTVMVTSLNQTALLMRSMKKQGYDPAHFFYAFGYSGMLNSLKEILGDLTPFRSARGLAYIEPTAKDFLRKFEDLHGTPSSNKLSALFYDSVQVLVDTHSSERVKWLSNIEEYSKTGAMGLITFDERGNRVPQIAEVHTLEQVAKEEKVPLH